jgi:hypothetical protein
MTHFRQSLIIQLVEGLATHFISCLVAASWREEARSGWPACSSGIQKEVGTHMRGLGSWEVELPDGQGLHSVVEDRASPVAPNLRRANTRTAVPFNPLKRMRSARSGVLDTERSSGCHLENESQTDLGEILKNRSSMRWWGLTVNRTPL